ncbi:sensor histidine kinase [Flavitalea flava]
MEKKWLPQLKIKIRKSSDEKASAENSQPDSKQLFLRDICHEIVGTFFSVSGISNRLQLAAENKEETKKLIDTMALSCREYKSKLDNLVEYIRFEGGISKFICESVNIKLLLEDLITETKYAQLKKNITISLSIAKDFPQQIISDGSRILFICTNLLSHVLNLTKTNGAVLIKATIKEGKRWVLQIIDQSGEMTIEDINNPSESGLIITRVIVEKILIGEISVSSELGKGTEFTIELPYL